MSKALGIVNFSGNNIWVKGLEEYRPIGAFSFLGRYRVIDFPISNMSNVFRYISEENHVLLSNILEQDVIITLTPNAEDYIFFSPNPEMRTTSITPISLRSPRIWNVSKDPTALMW